MKRIFAISIVALLASCFAANAQSILDRLKDRAKDAVEEKVEKGVNDLLDGNFGKKKDKKEKPEKKKADIPAEQQAQEAGEAVAASTWTCEECGKTGNAGKFCEECGAKKPGAEAPAKPKKQTESAYAKSDFVPGDEIIFDDDFSNERLGEFPSRWDLLGGYAEVGSLEGRKVISFTDDGYGEVQPLMKDQKHFLPDVFTLEFDLYLGTGEGDGFADNEWSLIFGNPDLPNWNGRVTWVDLWFRPWGGDVTMRWTAQKPNGGDNNAGEKDLSMFNPDSPLKENAWNHFAFSFNKRAFKGYVNGLRIINIPSAKVPSHFWFLHSGAYKYGCISNVRLAKGAVPLYDRLASDGKIITYAITFETGKADLKPESMVEINRIAKLMQENPGLEFEVQGHCDATGSDKVNDSLSQKRAEAIVAALVEQGIAQARLTAVGKGSHQPIASNSTDEGRAKNRRVEFIKK
ncbi:MAG: OmpA family protein [Bacteroidales bacterium]|nr:OmpA family protein [Bacteroidales bacterium]